MKSHITEAYNLIDKVLPSDWWEKYKFNKTLTEIPGLLSELSIGFRTDILKLENEIFDELNFSIFVGEYCIDKDFEVNLNKLIDRIGVLNDQILMPEEQDLQDFLENDLRQSFIAGINLALSYYTEFYREVQSKLGFAEKIRLLTYHDYLNQEIQDDSQLANETYKNLDFFSANIFVASCDHFLNIESSGYQRLFEYSTRLSKGLLSKVYAPILRIKCDFLIAKILLRKQKETEIPVYILKGNKEQDLDIGAFDKDYIFKEEFDYLLTHYEIKADSQSQIANDCDEIKELSLTQLTTRQLHRLIKFNKDVSKNIQAIKFIRDEITRRFNKAKVEKNLFDIYTYSIALNYCINNEFSILCSREEATTKEVESLYKEILDIQDKTGVRNFFPQTKFLNVLSKDLKRIYDSNEALDSVKPCYELIDKCKELIKIYHKNVEWSKKNFNYVFQLPYKECLINTKYDLVPNLFIFSSFLMPLPRKKYIDGFKKEEAEVQSYELSISIYSNINKEIGNLKILKDELTKKQTEIGESIEANKNAIDANIKTLQEKEIKTMEILGVFTAIVTFLAGTISGFKFIETAGQAIMFTLSLSTSLAFFVVLIMTLFKKEKEYKTLGGFLIAATVFWSCTVVLNIGDVKGKKSKQSECDTCQTNINSNNSIIIKTCDSCSKSQPTQPPPPKVTTKTKVIYTYTKCPCQ